MTKYEHGKHPNSLAQLTHPQWNSETAREAQKKSAASRRANIEARERLKVTARQLKEYKKEMEGEEVSAVSVLEMLMVKAIDEDDLDTAADLAKSLAEFQTPKLARVDQTNTDLTAEDMSEDELNARIRALMEREDNEESNGDPDS